MTNKEIKSKIAKKMVAEFGEVGAEITEFLCLNDNSEYFHPIIHLKDDYYFYTQADIRNTRAYAFCVFKQGEDKDFKMSCDTDFSMLKKIFENLEFYYPKIKYQYDRALNFRKALDIVNKKLGKAYIDLYKKSLVLRDSNSFQIAQAVKQEWLRACSDARVPEHISQNEMNEILDARTRWDRKQYKKSFKPVN